MTDYTRKSFTLGKGFRINLSRRGIGWSAGIPKLFRFGVGADRRVRSSFGTGLLRHEFDHGKATAQSAQSRGGCCGCLAFSLLAVLALILFIGFVAGTSSGPDRESPLQTPAKPAGNVNRPSQTKPNRNPAPPAALTGMEKIDGRKIPTQIGIWRSSDGRTFQGRITAIDHAADTITLERIDGEIFKGVPVSRLHPEEAARLRDSNPR